MEVQRRTAPQHQHDQDAGLPEQGPDHHSTSFQISGSSSPGPPTNLGDQRHRLLEVIHRLVGPAQDLEQVGEVVRERRLPMTIPLALAQDERLADEVDGRLRSLTSAQMSARELDTAVDVAADVVGLRQLIIRPVARLDPCSTPIRRARPRRRAGRSDQ